MPDDESESVKLDRALLHKADELIPKAREVIERAARVIQENKEHLRRIRGAQTQAESQAHTSRESGN